MDIPIVARALALIALGWVILTSGVTLTHGYLGSQRSPEPAIPLDLLARELLRCAELGPQAAADLGCKAAWAQSRQRFFAPESGRDLCSSCNPGDSPSVK